MCARLLSRQHYTDSMIKFRVDSLACYAYYMTQYTQKWTLAALFEPLDDGAQYHMSDWPLHTTLADVFAADFANTTLQRELEDLLTHAPSFTIHPLRNAQLGSPHSPVDVTLLEPTAELTSLHTNLIDLLEKHGAIFNTPEYTREGFLPHVTVRSKQFLDPQTEIVIRSVSLIDLFPDSDWQQRRIVQTFQLQA